MAPMKLPGKLYADLMVYVTDRIQYGEWSEEDISDFRRYVERLAGHDQYDFIMEFIADRLAEIRERQKMVQALYARVRAGIERERGMK